MYEIKTKENENSVIEFIEKMDHADRREDAYRLLEIFTRTTGLEAKMWGPDMIGFGSYHYKYPSGHQGDAMVVGFSPRKAKISLYFTTGEAERERLLKNLGKHTAGKGCVYISKTADINPDVLKEFIRQTILYLTKTYPGAVSLE